ncbi:putative protein kinase RLK-Pelle-CrRLK1L-1 family [Helianthus debilis subsp. tardiflorus]
MKNNRNRAKRHNVQGNAKIRRFRLRDILVATHNFSDEYLIAEGALVNVYNARQLLKYGNFIAVRRLNCKYRQGDDLQKEASLLKRLEHKHIASIYEFFDQYEKIIIYEAFHGTLKQHLNDLTLTWPRRLQICLGVARALSYIHYINSSKIILDENWEPKLYGFELSTKYPQSWRHCLLFSHYFGTNNMTPKYDVYCFGVLMLEVLYGRKPTVTNNVIHVEQDEIIDPNLRKHMDRESLSLFKELAYKCMDQFVQGPTMDKIVKELEDVLELQWNHANLEIIF